jgi:hypothetical protein
MLVLANLNQSFTTALLLLFSSLEEAFINVQVAMAYTKGYYFGELSVGSG